jgi:hypothetical protein
MESTPTRQNIRRGKKANYVRTIRPLSQSLLEAIRPFASQYELCGEACDAGRIYREYRDALRQRILQQVEILFKSFGDDRSIAKIKEVVKNQAPRRLGRLASRKLESGFQHLPITASTASRLESVRIPDSAAPASAPSLAPQEEISVSDFLEMDADELRWDDWESSACESSVYPLGLW